MVNIRKLPIWTKAIISTIGLPLLLTSIITISIVDLLIVFSLKLWALLMQDNIEYNSFVFSRLKNN
jgi:hypothetical protein